MAHETISHVAHAMEDEEYMVVDLTTTMLEDMVDKARVHARGSSTRAAYVHRALYGEAQMPDCHLVDMANVPMALMTEAELSNRQEEACWTMYTSIRDSAQNACTYIANGENELAAEHIQDMHRFALVHEKQALEMHKVVRPFTRLKRPLYPEVCTSCPQ